MTGTWQDAEAYSLEKTKMEQYSAYEVRKIITENSMIKSYYLKAKHLPKPRFKPGQFLTLKTNINGLSTTRSYSISSAPADNYLRISIKREKAYAQDLPDGVFSNHMHDNVKEGAIIMAKQPAGGFTFDTEKQRPAILLAGGIGITPMISMAKHALMEGIRTRKLRPTTLICAASNIKQQVFHKELEEISQRADRKIRHFWCLSDSDQPLPENHYKGRISKSFLQTMIPKDDYDFYLCGPSSFMQSIYDILRDLGINDKRIYAEEFGPASLQRDGIELAKTPPPASEAIVNFKHSRVDQAWSEQDRTLLDFAQAHGIEVNSGCRVGKCGSCKTSLLSGSVNYTTTPSFPVTDNEILLCCSIPAEPATKTNNPVKIELAL